MPKLLTKIACTHCGKLLISKNDFYAQHHIDYCMVDLPITEEELLFEIYQALEINCPN